MQLILGYEMLQSYKRLPYKPWYAFAEFIDNSTQSYRNNKALLDSAFEEEGDMLSVSISYINGKTTGFIEIRDNAYGMTELELRNALTLGKKPEIDSERSKYGLGLKTAAFWFGDTWTIETTQLGHDKVYSVTVDLEKILADEKEHYRSLAEAQQPLVQFVPDIPIETSDCNVNEHRTIIKITSLNRTINSRISNNCVEYLQSIYRFDLQSNSLYLTFQSKILDWDPNEIDKRLLKNDEGEKFKRSFKFYVNGKLVTGWAGIMKNGARRLAGFSLIQADRVIMGYPLNYKPTLLFGDEEGGTNNLVNQRLTGELRLDNFNVSHTKDQIQFSQDEEDELNKQLFDVLADYKTQAESHRLQIKTEELFDFDSAITTVFNNIKSPNFRDVIFNRTILPEDIIEKTNLEVINRILRLEHREYNYLIDGLKIRVLISDDSSAYDPYLIVKTEVLEKSLTIVINKNHPYWDLLGDKTSIFNFLLTCLYDGVSEWKAQYLVGNLSPDTIKIIKDQLLRLPLKTL